MISKTLLENKQDNLFKKHFPFLIILIIFLPVVILLAFFLAFKDRVYPNVYVCSYNLGGQNQTEAQKILKSQAVGNFPQKILLIDNQLKTPLVIKSFYYSEKDTFNNAYNIGRGKSFIKNLSETAKTLKNKKYLKFSLYYDEKEFNDAVEKINEELSQLAINPQLKITSSYGKKELVLEKGKSGQVVDVIKLKSLLIDNLSCPKKEIEIQVPFLMKIPSISDLQAEKTKTKAESFLNKQIKLHFNNQDWIINDEELINFLSFYDGYNQPKIASYATDLAKVINSPPGNPTFNFKNSRVVIFKPAKEGIAVKEADLANILENRLGQIEKTKENQEIEIPVVKISPKITAADTNNLGIKELIGKGSSDYSGSITDRVYNLTLATNRLNGILIPPGEEFSFLKSLGEVNQSTGYRQAYIIKEGKTILGDGGGVCQVSTTLFRAALNSGLPITERHAHAYRVSYYEKDIGPGFDATVFEPSIDLRFINNTGNYILIQSSINKVSQKIYFEIYGTSDGRKVEISPVRVYDRQAPPPDLYQDDPSLPLGKIKQTEHRIWGSKTAFDYKVTRNNKTLEEKTYFSNYRPWQAVYLRGTGR